jgi:anti-sigma factor RsiW
MEPRDVDEVARANGVPRWVARLEPVWAVLVAVAAVGIVAMVVVLLVGALL